MTDTADRTPLVTGLVVIGAGCPTLTDATMHITLEDVTAADAAAPVLADTVVAHVGHGAGETVVPFALDTEPAAIDPRRHYAVRVWVDGDGDGRAGPGDLYSDQRHPVLTRGHPGTVTVVLGPEGASPR